MKPLPISEDDLQAYVDAQLTQARRAEVAAWLAEHPGEAERVRAYQAQNEALKDLFNPVASEPLPESWLLLVEPPQPAAVDRPKTSIFERWPALRLAAGVLLALLGGIGGWLAHEQYPARNSMTQAFSLPRQAAVAHVVYTPDVRRPVEVTADQEEQLVKWLSKRLGTPVKPPKLGGLGYELVGGRLLPGTHGPVAQFMYQEAAGQRLTLYVTTENIGDSATVFRFAREGEINVFYWVDGPFGYALSGSIGKGELARLATAVYDQLQP